MAEKVNVSVGLDEVSKVAGDLETLSQNISTTLGNLYTTVGTVTDGAINGQAPGTLINTYESIHTKLATYPKTLSTLATNLSKSGNIYDSIDSAASSAATVSES